MQIKEQVACHWAQNQKEIELVWCMLPRFGQEPIHDAVTQLHTKITTCLLATSFSTQSAQQIGAQLAQRFNFQPEKPGQLQCLLAEQLLMGLDEAQTAWLAPRIVVFWAEMSIGYGQAVQEHYATERALLHQKIKANFDQASLAATESEARFEALFMGSNQPVFLHENGRVLAINAAVINVFGYSADELLGKQIQLLIQTMTSPSDQALILKQIESGQEQPYRIHCLTKSGASIAVEAATRLVTYHGRTVHMVLLRPLDESYAALPEPNEANLTPRQKAVLYEMATGFADKEIAERLSIGLSTVQHHKKQIFEKLKVDTRAKVIAWAWQKLPPLDSPT